MSIQGVPDAVYTLFSSVKKPRKVHHSSTHGGTSSSPRLLWKKATPACTNRHVRTHTPNPKISPRKGPSSTYTEDQDAPNNGGVLRRSDLVVRRAQEALLRTTRVGKDNALLGRHNECVYRIKDGI